MKSGVRCLLSPSAAVIPSQDCRNARGRRLYQPWGAKTDPYGANQGSHAKSKLLEGRALLRLHQLIMFYYPICHGKYYK
jgi:hypothetical protein